MTDTAEPAVAVSTADRLRRTADLLERRAQAAAEPSHPWGDITLPLREGPDAFRSDMDGYLGGSWGEYAGSVTPWVASHVVKLLRDAATEVGNTEARNAYTEARLAQRGPGAVGTFSGVPGWVETVIALARDYDPDGWAA